MQHRMVTLTLARLLPAPAAPRPTCPRAPLGDVVRDTRGAVFLLGIGLGVILLGVAWNVSSVGAAALWRERASDIADAAAFDAAVWHARGMNLLVMSNLLMAVFMALFTFWRMLVTVIAGLSYLCNWPVFPECAAVQPIARHASRADERVAGNLGALQRSLSATERAIASLAPLVPLARTPSAVLERYPEAKAVRTFSQALLPSRSGATRSALASNAGDPNALDRRLGVGVSLPVEADTFELLCSRSVEAQAWLERRSMPFDVDRFGPWWRAMTGSDPGFFCLNESFPPEQRQAVQAGLVVTCAGSDEPASCVRRRLARFLPSPLAGGPGAIATARIWQPFENGGPFAAVSAVAELPRPLLAPNDRGLVLPEAPGQDNLRRLSPTGHVAAQAEYYFDCTGSWEECREDAPWRLWYRARLRPLRTDLTATAPWLAADWGAAFEDVARRYGGEAWRLATEIPGRATPESPDARPLQ